MDARDVLAVVRREAALLPAVHVVALADRVQLVTDPVL